MTNPNDLYVKNPLLRFTYFPWNNRTKKQVAFALIYTGNFNYGSIGGQLDSIVAAERIFVSYK